MTDAKLTNRITSEAFDSTIAKQNAGVCVSTRCVNNVNDAGYHHGIICESSADLKIQLAL